MQTNSVATQLKKTKLKKLQEKNKKKHKYQVEAS
jgi:hypothetical protein